MAPIVQTLNIHCNYNIEWKYLQGKELGQGQFDITYLYTDKDTNNLFACKSISKKQCGNSIQDVLHEVAILRHLPKHPNIVSLKGAYNDSNAMNLVMDLCEGGELYDRIIAKGYYPEREAAILMRTIMEVVQTCHNHGVMHRDLKPENLLFANKNEDSSLKAIDFGLAVFFTKGQRFSELVGTPLYIAPEVWRGNYGPEVDIWSAGVILYFLLSGRYPFNGNTSDEIEWQVMHARLKINNATYPWSKVSPLAKSLVRHMLKKNPKTRYNVEHVLNHPWIQINASKEPT